MVKQMELILHLGVHRTGTTALQQMLQRRQPALEAEGVRFWGPQVMRIGYLRDFVPQVARAGDNLGPVTRLAPLAAALHDEAALAEAEGARRLIVSDENLLGAMRENYDGATLYAEARNWLIATAALFPCPPDHIYIGFRNYADYAVSIYSHLVMRGGTAAFDSARMMGLGEARGWFAVLADVRAVFAQTQIHVWRYARCAGIVPATAQEMLGNRGRHSLSTPRLPAQGGLSAPAVDAICALWNKNRGDNPAATRARAETLRSLAGVPYDPFTAAQRAELSTRFEQDWGRIAAGEIAGVEVFDPLAAEGAL